MIYNQRERFLPADATAAFTYVALGNSVVYGTGASSRSRGYVPLLHHQLQTVYPHARLHNLGSNGATAEQVLTQQLAQAVALRPHLVTLSVGPNDLTQARPLYAYTHDLEDIFERLTSQTEAVVVASTLPDITRTPLVAGLDSLTRQLIGDQVQRFNGALYAVAGQHDVEVVDVYEPSRQMAKGDTSLTAADGYHPSDDGYAHWAELMWRGIERRLPQAQ
ncbi:MAG: SGNH/GDSL hydrolase family protein [Chloroflexaceae bacterium]|jgi:lysophospholipase L1-like esterase|nr:SGNH/GDSL hydrolase family protein [Chloroflexaceae bacterium]